MLQNYLKIALRSLRKRKAYSAINIGGLAVGMACCLLILLFVRHELSYDRAHPHAERVHRIAVMIQSGDETLEAALAPAALGRRAVEDLPAVEEAVRLSKAPRLVSVGDEHFYEERFVWADAELFSVFDFPLVRGDAARVLRQPDTAVLTESTARRYFGAEDPMGKTIVAATNVELEVVGIARDLPDNLHFKFDVVAASDFDNWNHQRSWLNHNYKTYLRLAPGADPEAVAEALGGLLRRNIGEVIEATGYDFSYYLQPLTSIHLHSHLGDELEPNGHIDNVYLFSIIAGFVLLIACINFTNLSTARAADRFREVGVRKAAGAHRWELVGQFLGESVLVSLVALGLTVLMAELLLPAFSDLAGRQLGIDYGRDYGLLLGLLGLMLGAGVLAGAYPAFYLSSFAPAAVLKGAGGVAVGGGRLRSGLVVVQFAIATGLLVSTLVVAEQMTHLSSQKLGFDKENLVVLPLRTNAVQARREALKAALLTQPGVAGVSASHKLPGFVLNNSGFRAVDRPQEAMQLVAQLWVDPGYVETMRMNLVAGRDFRGDADIGTACIVNEAAARALGLDRPVGARLSSSVGTSQQPPVEIVGVVEDFNFLPLRSEIQPLMLMRSAGEEMKYMVVRLDADDVPAALERIEGVWDGVVVDAPFELSFFDQRLDALYRAEQRLGRVFVAFVCLAVGVACLGLLGLASFTAERRTKEIGVRKVLGASAANIAALLSGEFARLVLVANAVAWPAAYWWAGRWLDDFAYRADLDWTLFLAGGGLTLLVAMLTVSGQAVRAALKNPIEALRYE